MSVGEWHKPQLAETSIAFPGGSWSIIRPRVIRYEDNQWIDEFFESGKLRLASFTRFANYEDEQRGDTHEGMTALAAINSDANELITAFGSFGENCYVFCCSLKFDFALQQEFKRDSQFQIFDTTNFAYAVSRVLPGFCVGLEGYCIYENDGPLRRKQEARLKSLESRGGSIDKQAIQDELNPLFGVEPLFLKRRWFLSQQEYRFIWKVDHAQKDYIDVECPQATKFCRRLSQNELNAVQEPTEKGSFDPRTLFEI